MLRSERWFGNGASIAVILANFWLKQYKTALSRDIPEMFLPEKDLNGICPECKKKVTSRSKGLECECCLNWYHVKCADLSDDEYRIISETISYCRKCIAIRKKNKSVEQANLFVRYVDDIERTVRVILKRCYGLQTYYVQIYSY